MVPNMAHCGGGAATASFAGNELKAITDWVENGTAPERIVATNTNATSPYPAGGLFDPRVAMNFPASGTRPLCVYPKIAAYKGSGMTNDAGNFACVDPGFSRGGDHDFHDDDDGRGDDRY
jgi:feruloyl esterase